jgi:hypothetical protein
MEHANPNPIFIGLLFILRCAVPLGVLLGISYLLRRLGLIEPPASQNADQKAKN